MTADSPIVSFPFSPPGASSGPSQAPQLAQPLLGQLAAWDVASSDHSQRVGKAATEFGRFIGLAPASLEQLRLSAFLHDIGKLRTPISILTKDGPLDDQEYERIKQHSEDGAAILSASGFSGEIIAITRHHHEWWNGHGYPSGCSGTEIPRAARIIGIVDAWDAITARRSYHRRRPEFLALSEIRSGTGSQFDPDLAPSFIDFAMGRIAANRRCA